MLVDNGSIVTEQLLFYMRDPKSYVKHVCSESGTL